MDTIDNRNIIVEIRNLILKSRENIAREINRELLTTYWNVGRIIVENEQEGFIKAEYGKELLKQLSKELTKELGKGFSVSNSQYMRRFYQTYQI